MILCVGAAYKQAEHIRGKAARVGGIGLIVVEVRREAENIAGAFSSLFGMQKKTGNSSVFAGTAVEAMKSPYLGKNGHIAVKTKNIERATAYLERCGVKLNWSSAKKSADGALVAVYLEEEFGGFAIHLVQAK